MQRAALSLLFGALVGVALGLYLGWVAFPVELTNVGPSVLDETTQADYLRMVAATYDQDGDFEAARQRLALLGRSDTLAWLRAQTVDTILQGENEQEARQLAQLADRFGLTSPAFTPYLPTPAPTTPSEGE